MFYVNLLVVFVVLRHKVAPSQETSAVVKRSVLEESVISLLKDEENNNRNFQSTVLKSITNFQTKLERMRKNMNRSHTELLQEVIRQRAMSSSSFERILSKLYCPSQYRYFRHSCFKLSNTSADWETMKRKCHEGNSQVVLMDSNRLRTFLGQDSLRKSDTIWAADMGAILSSNLLTTAHVALLRKWFPTKTFNLLYRASRDGMNGSVFHSRCNNMGPTISIGIDSTSGTTVGGYASVSWTSANGYKNDSNAFVFRLCRQGCTSARYSQYRYQQKALYDNYNCGPIFGGGHDLKFFSDSCSYDSSNRYFSSNGYCYSEVYVYNGTLGCGYNVKWTDVEVWSVADGCAVFNFSSQNMESKACSDKAHYICEL